VPLAAGSASEWIAQAERLDGTVTIELFLNVVATFRGAAVKASYVNSKILLKLQLAGSMSTGGYIEFNTMQASLDAVSGAYGDAELPSVRAQRSKTKADVVVLLTTVLPTDSSCGIGKFAELPGNPSIA